MIYPEDFESKIGFDTIRTLLSSMCESRLGRDEVANMQFSFDFTQVLHSLNCVNEMMKIRNSALPYFRPSSIDILPALSQLKLSNSFVPANQMFEILTVLESFEGVKKFFDSQKGEEGSGPLFPSLQKVIETLTLFPEFVSLLSNAVNKFGELKDTASPALYDIRKDIKQAQGSMHRAMSKVMDRAVAAGLIDPDVSPSIRNGRLVVPVNAAQKRQISGIIHDESASGKTVYIEPAEVVEASNRLRELQMDEKREETKILVSLADSLRPCLEIIRESCFVMGRLDFIDAKARLAIDLGANLPNISSKPELEWYSARHPGLILSLRNSGRNVVPLTLTLNPDKRILIISGPNAGGKSVTLKTVACVQYMLQCGLLPTLNDNSHVGIFKNIFIDIGDEQSFENDLSTYSSHLKNMRFFVNKVNRFTLLLADEMGSGTEPVIGGAIAQAILDNIAKSGCFAIVTTHYQNLKTFADETPGFINGAMLYDRAKLQPTFQLSVGNAGSSFALDIAYKMGLPKEIIEKAKNIVGDEYISLDKYLSEIARDKKYWSNKRQNIREKEAKLDKLLSKYETEAGDLASQRKAIINEAKAEAKEILKTANARIERTILEIRNAQAEKEKTKRLRKELQQFADENINSDDKTDSRFVIKDLSRNKRNKEKTVESQPKSIVKREIDLGDYVILDNGTTPGQVMSISGKKADVAFGALRTTVELSRLKITSKPKSSALTEKFTISSSTSDDSRRRQLNFKTEIDVRGMRADEAIQAVTYFLDDAIQFNAGRVRILHGTGHGILRQLIREQLRANPAVRGFADEDIRLGGAGITVVELH